MPLVKAVQELSQENLELKNEINSRNETLVELKKIMKSVSATPIHRPVSM